jgi:alpha-amylase
MPEPRYIQVYFQVHQPRRLKRMPFFDIGSGQSVFDDVLNARIMHRVAGQCYLPVNLLLLRLTRKYPALRISFSVSGLALDQLERYAPAALESFRMLARTGAVEFLGETYYHSLASLVNHDEFVNQVNLHRQKVKALLGVEPVMFRNTELIYNDTIGRWIHELGFRGTLVDGIDRLQKVCSPHQRYEQKSTGLGLLLRDYKRSDDIAFRYADIHWKEWPLTAEKYLQWLKTEPKEANIINLGMDYETFGEHQHHVTGIIRFLEMVLTGIARQKEFIPVTVSEALSKLPSCGKLSVRSTISWADEERDLSAWLGNAMQRDAFNTLTGLEKTVKAADDEHLLDLWRTLLTSDHFYYMSTKTGPDGEVHNSFNPYPSPYEAFINYMNVLTDLSLRLAHPITAPNLFHEPAPDRMK